MNVLLSIKPKYIEAIVRGDKLFEFRKSIFKDKHIRKVYMYSSAPVRKIVGNFRIGGIIEDHPERLWQQLHRYSGLDKVEFFTYFKDVRRGFAIEIMNVKEFEPPIDPRDLNPSFVPPQSFCYINPSILR